MFRKWIASSQKGPAKLVANGGNICITYPHLALTGWPLRRHSRWETWSSELFSGSLERIF
jgi:hypothetical protein